MKNRVAIITLSLLLGSCTLSKMVLHGGPDGKDYRAFSQDTLRASDRPFHFAVDTDSKLSKSLGSLRGRTIIKGKDTIRYSFDNYVSSLFLNDFTVGATKDGEFKKRAAKNRKGGAFVVIENDTIKYQLCSKGTDLYSNYLTFSVTKSFTSILCGIAIDQGLIGSVQDPVTKYIPELEKRDSLWSRLTIEHLLDMRSGLHLDEDYSVNFSSKMAELFYTPNQFKMVKELEFYATPGESQDYLSVTTTVLGVVLERAIGEPLAHFATKYLWQPLGMERNSFLSIDSRGNRSVKTFFGLTTNVLDLAKLGRLYLNGGNWDGRQIVSKEWVERTIAASDSTPHYSYQWWIGEEYIEDGVLSSKKFVDSLSALKAIDSLGIPRSRTWVRKGRDDRYFVRHYHDNGVIYALGIMDQILYIDTKRNLIVVRLGTDWTDIDDISNSIRRMIRNTTITKIEE